MAATVVVVSGAIAGAAVVVVVVVVTGVGPGARRMALSGEVSSNASVVGMSGGNWVAGVAVAIPVSAVVAVNVLAVVVVVRLAVLKSSMLSEVSCLPPLRLLGRALRSTRSPL